jgi:hypothetical protein
MFVDSIYATNGERAVYMKEFPEEMTQIQQSPVAIVEPYQW